MYPAINVGCILEFDGATGNLGRAGAGAVLRSANRNVLYRLREGLAYQCSHHAALYHGLILGLKHALDKGYRHITVNVDSENVIDELRGLSRINSLRVGAYHNSSAEAMAHQNLMNLHDEAMSLLLNFSSFGVRYISTELNSEANAEARWALDLQDGETLII